ncbi:MAG: superinfection immunity protein [Gammaproteobacteria bacterium]|nr:superinfection immunity protein [Gammaproteobacteria bacterium]
MNDTINLLSKLTYKLTIFAILVLVLDSLLLLFWLDAATLITAMFSFVYYPFVNFIIILFIFGAVAVVYFAPSIIAKTRKHRNLPALFVLNLLTGWSLLGWVASLVWSLWRDTRN